MLLKIVVLGTGFTGAREVADKAAPTWLLL
jgi:hypothetical protein